MSELIPLFFDDNTGKTYDLDDLIVDDNGSSATLLSVAGEPLVIWLYPLSPLQVAICRLIEAYAEQNLAARSA